MLMCWQGARTGGQQRACCSFDGIRSFLTGDRCCQLQSTLAGTYLGTLLHLLCTQYCMYSTCRCGIQALSVLGPTSATPPLVVGLKALQTYELIPVDFLLIASMLTTAVHRFITFDNSNSHAPQ